MGLGGCATAVVVWLVHTGLGSGVINAAHIVLVRVRMLALQVLLAILSMLCWHVQQECMLAMVMRRI
jgi:hypothetical protein